MGIGSRLFPPTATASDALWIAAWPDGPARPASPATRIPGRGQRRAESARRGSGRQIRASCMPTRAPAVVSRRAAPTTCGKSIHPMAKSHACCPDGQGGTITPSPNGRWLALASAGEYADAPGALHFFEPATGQIRTALTYPAVATASEWRWHAEPYWAPDGSGVLVAIPPVDLVNGGRL